MQLQLKVEFIITSPSRCLLPSNHSTCWFLSHGPFLVHIQPADFHVLVFAQTVSTTREADASKPTMTLSFRNSNKLYLHLPLGASKHSCVPGGLCVFSCIYVVYVLNLVVMTIRKMVTTTSLRATRCHDVTIFF